MIWADEWNAWASWDCASSHLSVALLYLIESAMISLHPSAGMGTRLFCRGIRAAYASGYVERNTLANRRRRIA